jgi:hypothetical protein
MMNDLIKRGGDERTRTADPLLANTPDPANGDGPLRQVRPAI